MEYNKILPGEEALVLLTEKGDLLSVALEFTEAFNELVVHVRVELKPEDEMLCISALSDPERADRCFFIGEVNIREYAEEQNKSFSIALSEQLDYAFCEYFTDAALSSLKNALLSGQKIQVAYVWSWGM